ncbi:MAG: RNA polymerase sigma factor [Aeromonas hydrophila]
MKHSTAQIPVIATRIKTGKETLYPSITACADEGHFSRQYVMMCVHGTARQHCGHTFRAAPGAVVRPEMSARAREAARLRMEGRSITEVGALMGLSNATVTKYMGMARASGLDVPDGKTDKESPKMAECLALHLTGKSRAEIAEEMGVGVGTVKSHLMKAKGLNLITTIAQVKIEAK